MKLDDGKLSELAKPSDWFARFDYARRIGSHELMSREAESRQRMWFMAGTRF